MYTTPLKSAQRPFPLQCGRGWPRTVSASQRFIVKNQYKRHSRQAAACPPSQHPWTPPCGSGGDRGESPPQKKAIDWTIDEVVSFFLRLGFPADIEGRLRENLVDGDLLCGPTRAELIQELGLTPLQAAKVLKWVR